MPSSGSHAFEIGTDVLELNTPYIDIRGRTCIPTLLYQRDDGLVLFDGTLVFKRIKSGDVCGYCVPCTFSLTGEVIST